MHWWPAWIALGRARIDFLLGDVARSARLMGVVDRMEAEASPLFPEAEGVKARLRQDIIDACGEQQYGVEFQLGQAPN